MSAKNLFHAFHDYLSANLGGFAGMPPETFLTGADWNVTERGLTPSAGGKGSVFQPVLDNAGNGEKFLIKAFMDCAPSLVWRKRVVGGAAYFYVEVIGPLGHFPSSEIAGGLIFLPANTEMPNHRVVAETLLIPLAEGAQFSADKKPHTQQKSGTILYHEANESAAFKSGATPLLIAYVWRNGDLQQAPDY